MDYLPELLAALPALDAGAEPPGPWRLRRAGLLDLSPTGECVIEDPLGGSAYAPGVGPGPHPVYLVVDEDVERPEVLAALLHFGATAPVEVDDTGDPVSTDSGLLLLHGLPPAGVPALVDRALAALRRETPTEHWSRADHLAGHLSADRPPVDGEPGDFAEGHLLLPDAASGGPALALLVDLDGFRLAPVRDAAGAVTALLVHR
ncbi:hypothetical protein AB0D08_11050 [Kitasatospora sp. NPDC048540]|uniref:hypothetical protein n=1 Tax=unclassified Kitasatospora TaxID=2633591 RepID=UPI00053A2076|nr:hypothetical protein [Kitasatospora sp. MBT63]